MTENSPKRRWFQFRLRTLLVGVLVLSFAMSKLAVRLEKARHNQQIYAEYCKQEAMLKSLQADIGYTVLHPPTNWLDHVVGDPGEYYIYKVGGRDTFDDDDLLRVKPLARLEELILRDTQVSDVGLENIRSFERLKIVDLRNTNVTDAGLEHLEGLTNLWDLSLNNTQVTDIGLEHLKGFTDLWSLSLKNTQVTPEGVQKLQEALPNCNINY
jgi:hypothetical protein